MDLATLQSLGIDIEELKERIVEKAVEELLTWKGFNDESGTEQTYEARFKKEIAAKIQAAVDAKITAIANEHIIPRVGEMIEGLNLRKTNGYGEPKGDPMTFKEYIAERAEKYMSEPVDVNGKAKDEAGGYSWSAYGPRMTVIMKSYIVTHIDAAAKKALADVNSTFVKVVEKSAIEAIQSAGANLKITVTAGR